ncbi:unnamed protein product (macronuclear) [Paramecium tetraurelia]|uniref:Uncharacterized protein n=1 Tax=Paramecium tetraurelia TaxID=5888 RepID=A0DDN5_PARTE|nr:uncharacterized protein GSPATT00015993001 [Paramecium tetraurelia]CAK81152.1 unnamed protein product [Paramecium tetraurelia]|eukprot:XP_001448549.1 hypothetical protein (macronuclear) [Paramecium tetraurelia strain d4-2]
MHPNAFHYKFAQYPYQPPVYLYPQYIPQPNYNYYNFQHYKPPMYHQTQIPTQQPQIIIISDDEECVPVPKIDKPLPTKTINTTQSQKQIAKLLDLDTLEAQGKLYDYESSQSPPLPKRIIKKPQKPLYRPQKRKVIKTRREPIRHSYQKIKQVQIGAERQSLHYPQSNVKAKFIRVYEKQEDKCMYHRYIDLVSKLFESLKANFQEANDEDIAIILNMVGKDYQKAETFINENGLFLQSYLQNYKDLSEDDSTIKK